MEQQLIEKLSGKLLNINGEAYLIEKTRIDKHLETYPLFLYNLSRQSYVSSLFIISSGDRFIKFGFNEVNVNTNKREEYHLTYDQWFEEVPLEIEYISSSPVSPDLSRRMRRNQESDKNKNIRFQRV